MSFNKVVEHDHEATGAGASLFLAAGRLNVTISGTFTGTVQIERSLDNGVTWVPRGVESATSLRLTAPVALVLEEAESGALYRSNCTAFTDGLATARISQ